jgi:hypothetical protein
MRRSRGVPELVELASGAVLWRELQSTQRIATTAATRIQLERRAECSMRLNTAPALPAVSALRSCELLG